MAGPVIACFSPCDEISLDRLKEWVRGKGYTSEDVAIKKIENGYVAIAKRRLW